jgi:hypothetical protein
VRLLAYHTDSGILADVADAILDVLASPSLSDVNTHSQVPGKQRASLQQLLDDARSVLRVRADGRGLVSADAQLDDDGVVDGEDAGAGKGPAGGVPAGLWCAWWRLGGQSAVTSAAAVRALVWSTMALRLA